MIIIIMWSIKTLSATLHSGCKYVKEQIRCKKTTFLNQFK